MSAYVGRLVRHIASLPAEAAFHAFNLRIIEKHLYSTHLKLKEEHRSRLPTLSELEAEAVAALLEEGVFVTSLEDLALPYTEEMVSAGSVIANALVDGSLGPRSRSWRSSDGEVAGIDPYRVLFQWGVNRTLLNIVEGYLGLPPAYDGPKVAYTPADGRQAGTRLWHRDREDRRMMKIAIYLTDVLDTGGPLQCLKREVFDGPVDRDFSYPVLTHEELERRFGRQILDDDIFSCTGPVGTVVFMDTARLYHRGKPALSVHREAIFHSYFSRTPRHPFFCERSDLSRSELADFGKDLSCAVQRDAVEWRKDLGWRRFILRSSV
jgi:hypothetical protein